MVCANSCQACCFTFLKSLKSGWALFHRHGLSATNCARTSCHTAFCIVLLSDPLVVVVMMCNCLKLKSTSCRVNSPSTRLNGVAWLAVSHRWRWPRVVIANQNAWLIDLFSFVTGKPTSPVGQRRSHHRWQWPCGKKIRIQYNLQPFISRPGNDDSNPTITLKCAGDFRHRHLFISWHSINSLWSCYVVVSNYVTVLSKPGTRTRETMYYMYLHLKTMYPIP